MHSRYSYLVRVPLLVTAFLCVTMGILSKRGWLDWQRMEKQNSDLEMKIAQAKNDREEMERRIEALRTNPAVQERVVRQTLGYVKPQEMILEFP